MFEYTNSNFKKMRDDLFNHFQENMSDSSLLYRLDVDYEELWHLYLDSFPLEIKGVYRKNSWHDCSACRGFFKKVGNLCSIQHNEDGSYNIITLFDFNTIPEYQMVMDELSKYLHNHSRISKVFLSSTDEIGIDENYEQDPVTNKIIKHNHLYLELPSRYVRQGAMINEIIGDYMANKTVLESGLNSISMEAINIVLELIEANTLYRGMQWHNNLKHFQELHKEYHILSNDLQKELFLWYNCNEGGVSKIKNHSVGVLLTDLTNGVELEEALRKYETIVAPTNYQRPKPQYTEHMVNNAQRKITELGYLDSLPRRYANIDDIKIENTLYYHKNIQTIHDTIFDELKDEAIHKTKEFKNLKEYNLTDFINKKLPKIQGIELYFNTRLFNNLVSLTTSKNSNAKNLFLWDNPYAWSYRNNLADSNIKENVKRMGGDVDVDLRFSIQWNDNPQLNDKNDLDAHCVEPNGHLINYKDKRSTITGGWLDVDIINPEGVAVENIQYKNRYSLLDGDYLFRVHQYTYRGGDNGFKAEIEYDGNIHSFNYPFKLPQDSKVDVAIVHYDRKNDKFTFKDLLTDKIGGLKEWNLNVNTFIPVEIICWSPNYWENNMFGNKHLFFFLEDCVNPDSVNGFYNEFLNNALKPHRRVMEALSSKCRAPYTLNQLSGVGFSTSQRNSVVLRIKLMTGEMELIKLTI